MPPSRAAKASEIRVAGLDRPVELRRSRRAGRLTLRVNESRHGAVLTLPLHASLEEAGTFLARHFDWLREKLAALPAPIAFRHGAVVPLRGIQHRIRFVGPIRKRGVVWTQADEMSRDQPTDWQGRAAETGAPLPLICVTGDEEHGSRRLRDWLRKEARRDIAARVARHAENLALKPKRVSVRDQSTRWGSCSSTGQLSFSWRLILAPTFVLDYVAAHEVAHLAEMNHGPRFWKLVRRTMPRTDEAKRWLKAHGASLHRYGMDE